MRAIASHVFNLRSYYLEMILAKRKTVEGRPNKPELKQLKVNDIIRFTEAPPSLQPRFAEAKVLYLHPYPTFREMLAREGLQRCLPDIVDLESGVQIYHGFPSYPEKEKEHGVVAIGLELIQPLEGKK